MQRMVTAILNQRVPKRRRKEAGSIGRIITLFIFNENVTVLPMKRRYVSIIGVTVFVQSTFAPVGASVDEWPGCS